MPASPLPVPPELHRNAHANSQQWIDSARFSIDLLARTLGRRDLASCEILDVGCGTKLTKAILDDDLPIGRYVGVDAARNVIDWLAANVADPRFEYHHLDAYNELYNPTGTPLKDFVQLPTGPERFDLICLFSVFTHLDPVDYVAMLRLLRRHVRTDGRLLYSLFLRGGVQGAHALSRVLQEALASDDPEVVERARSAIARAGGGGPRAANGEDRFVDADPERPLQRAMYTEDYALELIEGTGWAVESVNERQLPHIQHYIVCTPV